VSGELEGSVRRADGRLRIAAQLVEATTGAHLWAEKFDGVVADVFDVQDRITESVVSVVEPEIRLAEVARSRRERPGSLTAYDLYLQSLPKLYMVARAENEEAYALLCKAIALEPDYGIALAMAAWALSQRIASGWPPAVPDERRRCVELAELALANARSDATILATSGLQLVQIGRDYHRGMHTIDQAVDANPNNLHVMMRAGIAHLHCGSVEDAMTYFRREIRLSPSDPGRHWSVTGLAHAHLILGQHEEALSEAERSHALNSSFGPTYWMLIAASVQLGRLDDARSWLERFRAIMPGVTIASILAGQPDLHDDRMTAVADSLRLVGLEDG
jgi:tetratricopeptide (TPR) repeat protein